MRSIWNVGFAGAGALFFLTIGILVVNSREPLHAPLQEARTPVEELKKDADDLAILIAITNRTEIRNFLVAFSKRLNKQINRQEELIVEGNRVSEAALRHIASKEFSQARLELSAAKSTYRRAAAFDKVEWVMQMENQLAVQEDEHNKTVQEISNQDTGTGTPQHGAPGNLAGKTLVQTLPDASQDLKQGPRKHTLGAFAESSANATRAGDVPSESSAHKGTESAMLLQQTTNQFGSSVQQSNQASIPSISIGTLTPQKQQASLARAAAESVTSSFPLTPSLFGPRSVLTKFPNPFSNKMS